MNTTTMTAPSLLSSSSSSSSSTAFPPLPTQGLKRIVSVSYDDYNYNDDRLQGSRLQGLSTSDNNNNGNKRRRYMRRGSRCPSMFATVLPDYITSIAAAAAAAADYTNQLPSSNKKTNTMTMMTKGVVGADIGIYDSSSRMHMMATTLPKHLTRLPTTMSPIVNNDDEDDNEVSINTMKGKQEEEQEQDQQSLSSGLSILREVLTLTEKQVIDDDDDEEDDDALILSAIRLLNQPGQR